MKECLHKDKEPRSLGEIWTYMDHELTLGMHRWKLTAYRQRITCRKCTLSVWATVGVHGFRLPS